MRHLITVGSGTRFAALERRNGTPTHSVIDKSGKGKHSRSVSDCPQDSSSIPFLRSYLSSSTHSPGWSLLLPRKDFACGASNFLSERYSGLPNGHGDSLYHHQSVVSSRSVAKIRNIVNTMFRLLWLLRQKFAVSIEINTVLLFRPRPANGGWSPALLTQLIKHG